MSPAACELIEDAFQAAIADTAGVTTSDVSVTDYVTEDRLRSPFGSTSARSNAKIGVRAMVASACSVPPHVFAFAAGLWRLLSVALWA